MPDINFQLERSILLIGHHLSNTRSADLKEYGLTASQWETLLFYGTHEGAHIKDLQEHLQVSHQAARSLVERMKEKQLLRIEISLEDAREKNVFPTEEGQRVLRELTKKGTHTGETVLQGLTDPEKEQLLGLLHKVRENL